MTTPATGYYVRYRHIPETKVRRKRLGRHFKYDSRSAAFPYQAVKRKAVQVLWDRAIPILNQGDVGSCTGNAMTGCLATTPVYGDLPSIHPTLNEAEALKLYSEAEVIDGDGPYPPNDDGSSGTSVMQAALNDQLIKGYTHATSVTDMSNAVQGGPVIIGINWYTSFDAPVGGTLTISADATVRGGHEIVVRGDDPTNQEFFADNSWGDGWAMKGSCLIPYATMEQLFGEEGDCTVPVPLSQPAPVPAPPQPPPPSNDVIDAKYASDQRLINWAGRVHFGDNRYAADAYENWRTARGYV